MTMKILRDKNFFVKGTLNYDSSTRVVEARDPFFKGLASYDGHRTTDPSGTTLAYEDITKVIAWGK